MPIQPTNYFQMNRALGQDIAGIPGSISRGAQAGATLGIMFDKFEKAQHDKKLFTQVKSDFIRELRSDLAGDPRLDNAIRIASRADSVQQLSDMAAEYIQLKDAEKRNLEAGGKDRYDIGMMGVSGGGKLFAQNAEKTRMRGVGQKAQKKMASGAPPEDFTGEQFKTVEPQMKMSAEEKHRQRMYDLQQARNKLLKAKDLRDAGKAERMDRFEAIKLMQQARLGIDMSNDAVRAAEKSLNDISGNLTATDQDKFDAKQNLYEQREKKHEWEDFLKLTKELLKEDEKLRKAQEKINEEKKTGKRATPQQTTAGTIQRSAIYGSGSVATGGGKMIPRTGMSNAPTIQQPTFQPTAMPGTTAVANTQPPRRKGTGF